MTSKMIPKHLEMVQMINKMIDSITFIKVKGFRRVRLG